MMEAMRHAFFDRNNWLGDPAFVRNPLDWLLSPDHAAAIRAADRPTARRRRATLIAGVAPHERRETTHYSMIDKAGNAVAVTYTINGGFGAGVIAGDTGFLLNDEMDDFTIKPGVPNHVRPGAGRGQCHRARQAAAVVDGADDLVLRDGHVFLVLGSPGGARIITIVLETALNIIDYGMAPQEAVDAPRLHHQWLPDEVVAEPFALSPDTRHLLQAMGYRITAATPWGAAELIEVAPPQPIAPAGASAGGDSCGAGHPAPRVHLWRERSTPAGGCGDRVLAHPL